MRIVFAGTPEVALPALLELIDGPHEVVGVITREDAPVGRRRVMTPSAVGAEAESRGLPLIKANRLDESVAKKVAAMKPDLGVIVAYGGLVREPLLSLPTHGWINLHFSLLPRWRGAAPVQHAILAGDAATGVSVFELEEGLDTGPLYAQTKTTIGEHETSGSLLGRLADDGAATLAKVVHDIAEGRAVKTPQEGSPTLAGKLSSAEGRLDFTDDAVLIDRRIRAVTPEPGAWADLVGMRMKLAQASIARDLPQLAPGQVDVRDGRVVIGTATHPIEVLLVQPAGRKWMPASAWARGFSQAAGA